MPETQTLQPQPIGAPVEVLTDTGMQQEAVDNLTQMIANLQGQIDQLNTVVANQADTIARLSAVTSLHACPANTVAATARDASDHPLNIQECVAAGLCNCEAGYILTASTWTPPAAPS